MAPEVPGFSRPSPEDGGGSAKGVPGHVRSLAQGSLGRPQLSLHLLSQTVSLATAESPEKCNCRPQNSAFSR